jgi:CubicO group peptidase (beta-lactamase class C family)
MRIGATPETVGMSRSGLAAMDAAIQAHIDSGAIAGAVVLVARHGRLCHATAFGCRDIATGARAATNDLFRLFSMTKPVTAVAMLSLWDEGRWTLDDPIAKHLPEFADLRVCTGRDDTGGLTIETVNRAPTLRDLFTHSAGFSYGTRLSPPGDPVDAAYQAAGVWDAHDLRDMMARLSTLPLAYQPGTSWRYSLSMDVQGAIVERLTGQSLGPFLAERLFEPLGMDDTRFYTPNHDAGRLATLYLKSPGAPLTPIPNPMFADADAEPSLPLGGAGLVSTAPDYMRFTAMLLGKGELDGRRVLSADAVTLMTTNHLSDALMSHGFVAGHQRVGPGAGFGLNGIVFTDPARAGASVGRGSYQWDGAAGTWFWIDPENDLLVVGMVQTLSYTPPALQAETQALIAAALTDG